MAAPVPCAPRATLAALACPGALPLQSGPGQPPRNPGSPQGASRPAQGSCGLPSPTHEQALGVPPAVSLQGPSPFAHSRPLPQSERGSVRGDTPAAPPHAASPRGGQRHGRGLPRWPVNRRPSPPRAQAPPSPPVSTAVGRHRKPSPGTPFSPPGCPPRKASGPPANAPGPLRNPPLATAAAAPGPTAFLTQQRLPPTWSPGAPAASSPSRHGNQGVSKDVSGQSSKSPGGSSSHAQEEQRSRGPSRGPVSHLSRRHPGPGRARLVPRRPRPSYAICAEALSPAHGGLLPPATRLACAKVFSDPPFKVTSPVPTSLPLLTESTRRTDGAFLHDRSWKCKRPMDTDGTTAGSGAWDTEEPKAGLAPLSQSVPGNSEARASHRQEGPETSEQLSPVHTDHNSGPGTISRSRLPIRDTDNKTQSARYTRLPNVGLPGDPDRLTDMENTRGGETCGCQGEGRREWQARGVWG